MNSSPNPSAALVIIQIGTIYGADPPTCDPALDLDGEVAPIDTDPAIADGARKAPSLTELFTLYERSRDPGLIERFPVKPGQLLCRFAVAPLSSAAYRWASEALGVTRAQRAFLVACHSFKDGSGVEHGVAQHGGTKELSRGIRIATDMWLDHVQETLGAAIMEEVATLALERAKAGPRAVAPFSLPPGLVLPI